MGILPLRIETGRFSNLQIDQRICYMCKQNCNEDVVEDEMHFILDCHMFARELLELESIISNSSTELNEGSREYKFKTITDVWKEFSIYLIKCWEKRQDFIYDSMTKWFLFLFFIYFFAPDAVFKITDKLHQEGTSKVSQQTVQSAVRYISFLITDCKK